MGGCVRTWGVGFRDLSRVDEFVRTHFHVLHSDFDLGLGHELVNVLGIQNILLMMLYIYRVITVDKYVFNDILLFF